VCVWCVCVGVCVYVCVWCVCVCVCVCVVCLSIDYEQVLFCIVPGMCI